MVLKKSAYHVKFYKLKSDDDAFLNEKLRDTNREAQRLAITQRLQWNTTSLHVSCFDEDKYKE